MTSRADDHHPVRLTRAHVVPFVVFMVFMGLLQLFGPMIEWKHPAAPWWRQDSAQWIYPIQTLAALGCLLGYWKSYDFSWSWKWNAWAVVCGAVGIGIWLLPTTMYDRLGGEVAPWLKWVGVQPRADGFDPGVFHHSAAYAASLGMRFLRAVVVVALVEEIFWRGFLMRFVIDWEGDAWKQPFGRASWRSYLIVTGLFMAVHAPADWGVAWVYGSITYGLCVWSKSLGACVVMHATANLLMGLYIIAYGKYGLW